MIFKKWFERKQREEALSAELSDVRRRLHHQVYYNKQRFVWRWGEITYTGVWATGGDGETPNIPYVSIQAPKHDGKLGWICYIGPVPKMSECE